MIILSNLSIPGAIPASACIYTHVDQWISLPAHYHNPHQVGSEEKNMFSTCCMLHLPSSILIIVTRGGGGEVVLHLFFLK